VEEDELEVEELEEVEMEDEELEEEELEGFEVESPLEIPLEVEVPTESGDEVVVFEEVEISLQEVKSMKKETRRRLFLMFLFISEGPQHPYLWLKGVIEGTIFLHNMKQETGCFIGN